MILSIITINYNNISGLKKTFNSVLLQSFKDFEWIVIDGGSTDGSREIIESEQTHFAFWCSEPDTGIYNALNKGIKHARGEFVLFLNSGDWLFDGNSLDNAISEISRQNEESDIYYGNMMQVNDSSRIIPVSYPDNIGLFFFLNNNICHQASFYRLSLFDNNYYDESFSVISDWAMNINLLVRGFSFKHINSYITYYDNSGRSSISDSNYYDERYAAFSKYVPKHLNVDVAWYNDNYYFSRRRKSTRLLLDLSIKICHKLDKLLSTVERRRNN